MKELKRKSSACLLFYMIPVLTAAFTLFAASFEDSRVFAEGAGNASEGIPRQSGDSAAGHAIYVKYCHFCHGPEGRGDGPIGIAITPRPIDFTSDKRMLKTDKQLFSSISNGVRREKGGKEMAMPRWKGILTDKEIWDVLSYVRELEREGKKNNKK